MVSSSHKDVFDAALRLPMSERIDLAETLLASVDEKEMARIESAWLQVAEERLAAFKRGEIQAEPADDLLDLLEREARQ